MDTFDEYYVNEEAVKEPPRKVSPFADSPYECAYTVPVQKPKKEKAARSSGKGRVVLAVICVIVLLTASCGITAAVVGYTYQNRLEQIGLSTQQKLAQMEHRLEEMEQNAQQGSVQKSGAVSGLTPGQVYAQNADAVVCVTAYGDVMGSSGMESVGSAGSGFLISSDGYVVTNHHVVADMTEYYVVLQDKTELPATLVGYEASADVAVLKVEAEDLQYVRFGSSDTAKVGDQVVAIGYPLDSDTASLTVGYVSAKDQLVSTDGSTSNMLQTDAAINSGNSGGPLFNTDGEVIGITTAKFSGYSTSGASIEGMGFAVPIDEVLGIIQDLQEYGYVTGAYLGVYVLDVDAYVQMYGLPAGAYVEETMEGYAAERGGILAGDVIIGLDGYDISSVADLTGTLRRFEAGDTVSVTVWRNGEEVHLSVTLDEKPIEEVQQEAAVQPYGEEDAQWDEWFADPFFEFFGEYSE